MHFGDYTFILLLALVLFGPKKLPEIGRTVGKLLAEFRRASNEFKFQIQEELRNMEEEERRKKAAEAEAARAASAAMPPVEAALPATTGPTILPPSVGTSVSTSKPFAVPGPPPEPGDLVLEPASSAVEVEPSAPTPIAAPAWIDAPPDRSLPAPAHLDLTQPVPEAAAAPSANGVQPSAEEAAAHHD